MRVTRVWFTPDSPSGHCNNRWGQGMRTGPHNHQLVLSQEKTTPVSLGMQSYSRDQRCTRPLGVIRLAIKHQWLKHAVAPDFGACWWGF